MRPWVRYAGAVKENLIAFVRRSLWVLELGALAGSYLVYYFVGVQLEIIRLPHLLVFVAH